MNSDRWMSSEGQFHCLLIPSGKTYIPRFIKISLFRNGGYTKRKDCVPDKVLLRSVSTDVLATSRISTELFHLMKHPSYCLPSLRRDWEQHIMSHYAGADVKTNLRFMGPAWDRIGRLFHMNPHSHWQKSPQIEYSVPRNEWEQNLDRLSKFRKTIIKWQCGHKELNVDGRKSGQCCSPDGS
jgi:hypothetical protein